MALWGFVVPREGTWRDSLLLVEELPWTPLMILRLNVWVMQDLFMNTFWWEFSLYGWNRMSGNVFSHMPLEQVQILYRHEFFFRPYFHYCLRILHYCKDRFLYSCHYHYCNIPLHKTIYFSQFYAVKYDLTVVLIYFLISLFWSSI